MVLNIKAVIQPCVDMHQEFLTHITHELQLLIIFFNFSLYLYPFTAPATTPSIINFWQNA